MKKPITPAMFRIILAVIPIAAVNIIIIKDDRILLERRLNEPAKGYWFTPGGIILKGETVVEAAIRVCREETGLTVELDRLLGVFDEYYDKGYFTENIQAVLICYVASPLSGELKTDWQSDDIQWFPISSLPEMTGETVKKMIEQYKRD